MDPLIVPGHGLVAEGAAHTAQSCQEWPCDKITGIQRVDRRGEIAANGIGGYGHSLCSCGWIGPHRMSGADRRRDHRAHKHKIRGTVPA